MAWVVSSFRCWSCLCLCCLPAFCSCSCSSAVYPSEVSFTTAQLLVRSCLQLKILMFSCLLSCLLSCFVSQAGKHYPIALWGPILLGTIGGCGGLFLPLDKGLQASCHTRSVVAGSWKSCSSSKGGVSEQRRCCCTSVRVKIARHTRVLVWAGQQS